VKLRLVVRRSALAAFVAAVVVGSGLQQARATESNAPTKELDWNLATTSELAAQTPVAKLPSETTDGGRLGALANSSTSTSSAVAKGKLTDNHEKQKTKPGLNVDEKVAGRSAAGEPARPAKHRLIKFLGGKLTLDAYQHPIIGSPEAPHIVVEMVSYDCPHCRKMHKTMQHALQQYGDQVALLIMPVPLDRECNRLVTGRAESHPDACITAKLCVGIARINPSAFATFHDFLMSTKDDPPPMTEIVAKAYVLANRSQLRELMQGDELTQQLNGYIDLYAQLQKQSHNKKFGLPVQILGDYIMTGSAESEAQMFKVWEELLGVKSR
jgi:hypothetical protein